MISEKELLELIFYCTKFGYKSSIKNDYPHFAMEKEKQVDLGEVTLFRGGNQMPSSFFLPEYNSYYSEVFPGN